MPPRIYQGPSDGVDLRRPDGRILSCPHGVEVEIPDELVAGLDSQGEDWAKPAAPRPATVPELRAALTELAVDIPASAKKADLVDLLDAATAAQDTAAPDGAADPPAEGENQE